jgi:hypothetical protein
MLKTQATSAEDPEQENEDAAGVTSVEQIGVLDSLFVFTN